MQDKELQKLLKNYQTTKALERYYRKTINSGSTIPPQKRKTAMHKKLKKLSSRNEEILRWITNISDEEVKLLMYELYIKGDSLQRIAFSHHLSTPSIYRKLKVGREDILKKINHKKGE